MSHPEPPVNERCKPKSSANEAYPRGRRAGATWCCLGARQCQHEWRPSSLHTRSPSVHTHMHHARTRIGVATIERNSVHHVEELTTKASASVRCCEHGVPSSLDCCSRRSPCRRARASDGGTRTETRQKRCCVRRSDAALLGATHMWFEAMIRGDCCATGTPEVRTLRNIQCTSGFIARRTDHAKEGGQYRVQSAEDALRKDRDQHQQHHQTALWRVINCMQDSQTVRVECLTARVRWGCRR